MATYTKSTGYEYKKLEYILPYSPTSNWWTVGNPATYEVPEGKFAFISQVWFRSSYVFQQVGGNRLWVEKNQHSGEFQKEIFSSQLYAHNYDSTLRSYFAQFQNTVTPYGQWSAANFNYYSGFGGTQNEAIPASYDGMRILRAGERVRSYTSQGNYTIYAVFEIFEFTPQV